MYHNLTVPAQCIELWQACRSLVPELVRGCPVKAAGRVIGAGQQLEPQSASVYLIKEGELFESFDGQLIVIHEAGDLVNADGLAQRKLSSYRTDFPVSVDEYDAVQLLDAIAAENTRPQAWLRYLSCLSHSYQLLMCHFSRQDTEYLPQIRQYKKDDVIIEEGSEGDEVFTLLKGSARVVSNNEEVGEIRKDEIFGAIAALTHTRRTASVIASSDCDTLVANGDSFRSLLATRPDIVQKLIEDMARTIVSSNEKIIALSRGQSPSGAPADLSP